MVRWLTLQMDMQLSLTGK